MAIHEKVLGHSVMVLRLNIESYTYLINLTLESGWKVVLQFQPNPPADNFLDISFDTRTLTAAMFDSQYAPIYHILQSESQVFCSALNIFGIIAVNVTTEPDLTTAVSTSLPKKLQNFDDIAKLVAAHNAAKAG